jgi:formate hydrogenlyase subunit 3/multisubunit Na+/H+ antiporter MnhD subunit
MLGETERKAVLNERARRRLLRGGIGLYRYEQEKSNTSFQFFAQIVIGVVFFLAGLVLLYGVWLTRRHELEVFGNADRYLGSFAVAASFVLIGSFFAHAGVIYYWRKFRAHVRAPHPR